MTLELSGVHVFGRTPGTQQYSLTRVNPLMRFSAAGGGVVYLQNGAFYFEDGTPLSDELPQWLLTELAKCDPAALASCGYGASAALPPKATRAASIWTCPDCGEEMDSRTKGLHRSRLHADKPKDA